MLLQTDAPAERAATAARGRARRRCVDVAASARPTDVAAVRRLVKVARALGDDALQQAALGALVCARRGRRRGRARVRAARGAEGARARRSRSPSRHAAVDPRAGRRGPPRGPLRRCSGPTLAEALGPSLQACGVGRTRQGRPAERPRAAKRDRRVGGRLRHPRVRPVRRRQGPAGGAGHPGRAAGARRRRRRQRAAGAPRARPRRARAPRHRARHDRRPLARRHDHRGHRGRRVQSRRRARSTTRPTRCSPRSSASSARRIARKTRKALARHLPRDRARGAPTRARGPSARSPRRTASRSSRAAIRASSWATCSARRLDRLGTAVPRATRARRSCCASCSRRSTSTFAGRSGSRAPHDRRQKKLPEDVARRSTGTRRSRSGTIRASFRRSPRTSPRTSRPCSREGRCRSRCTGLRPRPAADGPTRHAADPEAPAAARPQAAYRSPDAVALHPGRAPPRGR